MAETDKETIPKGGNFDSDIICVQAQSENENIATVNDNIITGVSVGTTYINTVVIYDDYDKYRKRIKATVTEKNITVTAVNPLFT